MATVTFWKPGTAGPAEQEGNIFQSAPSSSFSTESQRERLPITKHMEKYTVTIVVGQTGCRKTTQLLRYLMEAGWAADGNVIACTQPRRVAATSVASRVAAEANTTLSDKVGYIIRFEDVSDKTHTRIHYMTDGMLFRGTLVDPLLSRFSVIMIDEAHERSLYTDLLLGILKRILRKPPSLRLIISSATLDAMQLLSCFEASNPPDIATIISLEGRMYPIKVSYLQATVADYVKKAAEVAWHINLESKPGDILVFLPRREDIERCLEELVEMVPMYARANFWTTNHSVGVHCAGMSTEEQLRVFNPAERNTRKITAATNIAEASVTIEGVRCVVDYGFVKVHNGRGTHLLATVPVSAASAIQRAGRAGRTAPGICYRLYLESTFNSLSPSTPPEITRTDMTTPILQLKSLGIDDLMKFESPGYCSAGMIGEDGRLTAFSVDVNTARMLLCSKDFKCGEEILTIAAITSVQDVFVIPKGAPGAIAELKRRKFTAEEGCKSHALNFRTMSRAVSIRAQLKKYMSRFGLPVESCQGDAKRLRQCLIGGYWRNDARWVDDGTYRSVKGNKVIICWRYVLHLHPTSVLFTRKPRSGWVIFHELEETKKTPDWLLDYGPPAGL
ncbi:P-loop containing nucleoside triphosphate hydrolase protein [Hygrophoropsis aurantiaca]|uniref:P-loop containing nucleoside triphosphate hydrolase protein n=1 Tax=Hygrophoropsis aurantiaca TaxID=72124 RepID=A0ACB8AH37_9AGAM|nr:P-loop containing nucleoside triphosphate hydrolase protein [Hygrophoropsis aurantiaca]